MFLKHTINTALDGKAVLIVPDGLLSNSTHEFKDLRYQLLTQFNLHSILSLPIGILAPYANVKVRNLNSLAKGSAQPSISYEKIKDIEFSLPTYEDQVSLTKWFKEIESNKIKYIKALEEQIESLNALSDFVINQNSIESKEHS